VASLALLPDGRMLVADDVGAFTIADKAAALEGMSQQMASAMFYGVVPLSSDIAPAPRRSWLRRVCAWLCGKGWAG
jgi:hypothetical protein